MGKKFFIFVAPHGFVFMKSHLIPSIVFYSHLLDSDHRRRFIGAALYRIYYRSREKGGSRSLFNSNDDSGNYRDSFISNLLRLREVPLWKSAKIKNDQLHLPFTAIYYSLSAKKQSDTSL